MGKRIIILISIITAFFLISIPNISAVEYEYTKNSFKEIYEKSINEIQQFLEILKNNKYDSKNFLKSNSDLEDPPTPFLFLSFFFFMIMFSYRFAQFIFAIGLLTLFSIWYEIINGIYW